MAYYIYIYVFLINSINQKKYNTNETKKTQAKDKGKKTFQPKYII
jgi:hypothetical protein